MEQSINIFAASALNPDQLSEQFFNGHSGWTPAEAHQRWLKHGPNILPDANKESTLVILTRQFGNALVILLLIAAIISWFIGHSQDAYFILFILIMNALIGFAHEYQSIKLVASLNSLSPAKTKVQRNGKNMRILTSQVVPGDILILSAGDRVPADARIITCSNLIVDESSLTGESLGVAKKTDSVLGAKRIGELTNMLLMGTNISRGHVTALVLNTGSNTELGKINQAITKTKTPPTPLQRQINTFTKQAAVAIIVVIFCLYLIGILTGQPEDQILLSAISLAVAAIPEGLPILITVVMAVGIKKMATERALVKRIAAVETLGQVHTLITDKTGTLTQNSLAVSSITLNRNGSWVTISADTVNVKQVEPAIHTILETARLTAEPNSDINNQYSDPIDQAISEFAGKITPSRTLTSKLVIVELPFDSTTKFAATIIQLSSNRYHVMVKGAPQILYRLARRKSVKWWEIVNLIGAKGDKLIATGECFIKHPALNDSLSHVQLSKLIIGRLNLTGLIALADPLRPASKQTIAEAQAAGVNVVMATGDLRAIANSIAAKLAIPRSKVMAQVTPIDKLHLVTKLQSGHNVIAMTGDGVNDAPALKQADVGLAMGLRGTDVAKAAADIVILDDSIETIVTAIRSGRTIFRNVQRVVSYYLATNIAEVTVVGLSILSAGLIPLPLLPVQILWINLVTDGFTVLPLAVEPDHDDVMSQPPRKPNAPLLDHRFWRFIGLTNLILILLTMSAFLLVLRQNDLQLAQSVAFGVLSFSQIFNFLNARSVKSSFFKLGIKTNPSTLISFGGSLILQCLVFNLPIFKSYLGLADISLTTLVLIILYSSLAFWLVELHKAQHSKQ